MKAFSTAQINGSYDFFTGIITLDRFSESDTDLVKRALAELPPPNLTEEANDLRDIRALVKHEMTHFLDHVTTLWGMEFLARRSFLIRSIKNNHPDASRRAKVYLVNAIELQMHSDLVIIHKNVPFDQCNISRHALQYTEEHGAFIIVKFFRDDDLICDIPLSMLSLLEANAIANEYLSRFDDLTEMSPDVLSVAEATVERKLLKVLNEPSLSEYSVLIRLAKMHFPFLDTRQLLKYISALANFCLNLSHFSMGTINEWIRHSFENQRIGNGIWADLSREMSRHVVAFKTILFMYPWIDSAPTRLKRGHIELMKIDPYGAIEKFWHEAGRDIILSIEQQRQLKTKALRKLRCNAEMDFIRKTIKKNHKWMGQRNLSQCSFKEIGCIDILLEDDSVIVPPNRIDFDTYEHSFQIASTSNKADKLFEKHYQKIHMSLDQAAKWIEDIFRMKEAGKTGAVLWNGSISGDD